MSSSVIELALKLFLVENGIKAHGGHKPVL
jgi:hypothetical protein